MTLKERQTITFPLAWTHILVATAGVALGFMTSVLVAERSFVKIDLYRDDKQAIAAQVQLLRDVDATMRRDITSELKDMRKDIIKIATKLGVELDR